MTIHDFYEEDYLNYRYRGNKEMEYQIVMESDISMLRMWLALAGTDNKIRVTAGKKFNTKCIQHLANDLSVRIIEDIKTYCCYGCGNGGTIVSLVSHKYNISEDDAIDILYSHIMNNMNINSLGEKNYNIAKEIFEKYSSKEVEEYTETYLTNSKIKTDILISRVNSFAKKYGTTEESISKIAKRTSCAEKLVKKILDTLCDEKETITQEPIPFEFYWLPTMSIKDLNTEIIKIRKTGNSVRKISDGHHTFGDYIDMINELLKALCETYGIFKLELLEEENQLDALPLDIEYTPMSIEDINDTIIRRRENGESVKEISDGNHTFGEYIDMRNKIFMSLCEAKSNISWKSKKHFDEDNDPMHDGDFIAGINTPDGVITFHLKMKYWDELNIKEIDNSPEYDGYTKEDVKKRIKSLYKQN